MSEYLPAVSLSRIKGIKPEQAALLSILLCFGVGLVYALLAAAPLTDDTIHHFLTSRWLHKHPYLMVSVWGRPAVSWVYMPAAHLGFFWCRLTSLVIGLAACWYSFLLARDIGLKYAWLAVPLVFFQTQFFRLSTDMLTEPLFALLIVCAARNFVQGRYYWAALQFSASTAARPAGFFFAAFFGIVALIMTLCGKFGPPKKALTKLILIGVLLAVIPAIWNFAGSILTKGATPSLRESLTGFFDGTYDPLWLKHANAWDTVMFKYGRDGPLHYLILMPLITGGGIMLLMIPGYPKLLRMRRAWLIPALWTVFLVLHTFLRTSGLFASGGYARFFVSVAPLAGIMAVAGAGRFATNLKWLLFTFVACVVFFAGLVPWVTRFEFFRETWLSGPGTILSSAVERGWGGFSWILLFVMAAILMGWIVFKKKRDRQHRRGFLLKWPAVAFVAVCLVVPMVECFLVVRPADRGSTYRLISDFGEWLEREYPELTEDLGGSGSRKSEAKFVFSRWYLHMEQGWDPYDETRFGWSLEAGIAQLPKGSIVVWDSDFSSTEYDMPIECLEKNKRLRFLREFATDPKQERKFILRVYEVVGDIQGGDE